MDLEDYRTVFAAGSLVLVLIAAAPTLGLIVPFSSGGERFSEFWVLGSNHMAEDYPFNVRVDESYNVFVGVGNHMGVSSYYLVYVKFRNQTQTLPNATISEPSPLAPLYEFRAFVKDGGTWEARVTFIFSDVSFNGDSVSVNRVIINDEAFAVGAFSRWDSEHNGFYYQLFFELWLYNVASQSFRFHNRFVGIWLNMTRQLLYVEA
jgi:hypothetical protein